MTDIRPKMELPEDQWDEASLAAHGAEAVRLLCTGQFDALAASHGYALTHAREKALAIREDLERCLVELGAPSLAANDLPPHAEVKYLKPDDPLYAVVECVLPASGGGGVLLELVVTSLGQQKHVCLEDISVLA